MKPSSRSARPETTTSQPELAPGAPALILTPAKHWEPVCIEFARMIGEMRRCERWTHADLAEHSDLCDEMVRRVEGLKTAPTINSAKRLCRAFRVRLGPAFVEAERRYDSCYDLGESPSTHSNSCYDPAPARGATAMIPDWDTSFRAPDGVSMLGQTADGSYQQWHMQALFDKLDELINALRL